MDAMPFRERRFAPAEVRRILRSAAAIAEHDAATSAAERPLTAEEITRLGAELGLPESAIRRAIAGDAEGEPDAPRKRRRISFEEEIDGELDPARFEDLADVIVGTTGDQGRTHVIGRTLTWAPTMAMQGAQARALTVSVRVRDGRTRVRVEEDLEQMFLGLYLGIGLGLGLGGGLGIGVPLAIALRSPGIVLGVVMLVALAAIGLPTIIWRAVQQSRARDAGALHARLVTAVREGIASDARLPRGKARIVSAQAADDADAEAEADAEEEEAARVERR